MELKCKDANLWKEALTAYSSQIQSLSLARNKPNLVSLDAFYCHQLPSLLHDRNPNPYITKSELSQLMQWKLTRGKWRPRLMDFVSSLDEETVRCSSQKAFESLPDVSKAVSELTVLKGIGPATASAVLSAFAPDVAPFMSDEAMEAALGHSKDYSLKQYLVFVEKLQNKAKELSTDGNIFTPSDVERALWSSAIKLKLLDSSTAAKAVSRGPKRKRKH